MLVRGDPLRAGQAGGHSSAALSSLNSQPQKQEVGASHCGEVSTAARRQCGSSTLEPLRLFWVFSRNERGRGRKPAFL